ESGARSLSPGPRRQLRSAARAASGGRQSVCRAGKIEETSARSAHPRKACGHAPTARQERALTPPFPYKTVLLRRNLVSVYLRPLFSAWVPGFTVGRYPGGRTA